MTRKGRLHVRPDGPLARGQAARILTLAGYDVDTGTPGAGDLVGVPGEGLAEPAGDRATGTVLEISAAPLRSSRRGRPLLGLLLVERPAQGPSSVERLLATEPLDDTALLDRARDAIARMRAGHLTAAGPVDPSVPAPAPGYVLILDQPPAPGMSRNDALEMLFLAREEHPAAPILVQGRGHLADADLPEGAVRAGDRVSPWHLLEGAVAVWTYSAPLGLEAILAGHRPVVMGRPDWMGWGLTDDRQPLDRRQRRLTRAQLFAGLMLLAPVWYDPRRDRLCELEDVLTLLEGETRGLGGWLDRLRG